MSNTELIERISKEWDDSSQHRDSSPHSEQDTDTSYGSDGFTLEVISSSSITTKNVTSNPDTSKNSTDTSFDHLISEETVSDSETITSEKSAPSPTDGNQDDSKKSRGKKTQSKIKRVKPKRKVIQKKNYNLGDKPKPQELPSVYSRNQIARHNKRINKLKALEESDDSDASNETDKDAALDRDLDINLRIFEESVKSVDNVVIGEIQCNILDDNSCAELITSSNKNSTNVFKLSVNTNYVDNCDSKTSSNDVSNGDNPIDDIPMSDDPIDYSDHDSDLEILVSKPIIRKRAAQLVKKEKPTEKKQKLTMYDLIHDNVCLSPESKTDESDDESKEVKSNELKKSKTVIKKQKLKKEEPIEATNETSSEPKEDRNSNLPVPKLKVGADGEVVIDMDSLVIEQTGVSEARNALANSEVIEECGLSYTSYNKRNSFRKQWTPHETLKFYQVLSTIGTDFTLMATLFPGRTRKCMKRKFKKEEKTSPELIMKALSCKQNFNIDLLEKELQLKDEKLNQFKENSKKLKSIKKKPEKKNNKKETKTKRRSFFESSISRFQTC